MKISTCAIVFSYTPLKSNLRRRVSKFRKFMELFKRIWRNWIYRTCRYLNNSKFDTTDNDFFLRHIRFRTWPNLYEISFISGVGARVTPVPIEIFKIWVSARKKFWVPMSTGYRPEKKSWKPMCTGYRENFDLCRPLIHI